MNAFKKVLQNWFPIYTIYHILPLCVMVNSSLPSNVAVQRSYYPFSNAVAMNPFILSILNPLGKERVTSSSCSFFMLLPIYHWNPIPISLPTSSPFNTALNLNILKIRLTVLRFEFCGWWKFRNISIYRTDTWHIRILYKQMFVFKCVQTGLLLRSP